MPSLRLALATLLIGARAPSLDFVDGDLRRTHGGAYLAAVASFRQNAVCTPPRGRHTAQHRGSPYPAGEKLVLPLHERRVPIAANYEWHFLLATKLSWPGDKALGQALTPDLECATQHTFRHALNGTLLDARRRAMEGWSATCESLRPYSEAIIERHSPRHAHIIMKNTNVACTAANLDALDYRDRDLARQLTMGFDLVGCPVPDSHAYRPAPPTPERLAECKAQLAETQDASSSASHIRRLAQTTARRAAGDPEAAEAVWNATRKELARGLVVGPFTTPSLLRAHLARVTGRDKPLWPLPRFARWQGEAKGYRAIDDGKGSGTNRATALLETIVCPYFHFTLSVARENARLARAAGLPSLPMNVALHDLTAAYRFLPNSQPHMAVWPVHHEGVVKWFYMPGHPFGCVSSVMSFNRHAEALSVIARSLGVPAEHYYDDFILPDVSVGADTAAALLEAVVAGTGDGNPLGTPLPRKSFSLDLKKKQPAATINVVLGVETVLTRVVEGYVTFRATASRRMGILDMWRAARAAGRMSAALASTILGKTGFALTATFGRVGRAATLALVQRAHRDTTDEFTPALEHAHDFFEALLGDYPDGTARLPDMAMPTSATERQPILVYTDASFSRKRKYEDCAADNSDIISRLGFVLHDPEAWDHDLQRRGLTLYATSVPSLEVLATFSPYLKTYISQLEALAALTVFTAEKTWRDAGIDLRGRTVNFFIDNTAALSAFVNGYSASTDMARISNMLWLLVAGMRTRPWFEYCPSLANIADLPSRGKYDLLERLGAHRIYYVPLVGTTDWNAPLADFVERGAVNGI